jgi:hypothetical protein
MNSFGRFYLDGRVGAERLKVVKVLVLVLTGMIFVYIFAISK